MKLTVQQAVSTRPIPPDPRRMNFWANKEVLPVLQQAREGLNAIGRARATVDTLGTGAWLTAWRSPAMPGTAKWTLTAYVEGQSTSGSERYIGVEITAGFASVAGVVAQAWPTQTVRLQESTPTATSPDVRFTLDTVNRAITVDVQDDAANTMKWTVVVDTAEGLSR